MHDDLGPFLERLRADGGVGFSHDSPLRLTCVPGRLDAFGGIIDYTGGTVCETPIAATLRLALQRRDDRRLVARSLGTGPGAGPAEASVDLELLLPGGEPRPYPEARAALDAAGVPSWARYLAGAWLVLVAEGEVARIDTGATVVLDSGIPLGGGLSSSAAIECAMLGALTAELGIELPPKRLAWLGQRIENHVVGAPCGLMDQLTVTLGRAHSLLVIRCQPDEILATPRLPDGVALTAVETGVKHSVGGGAYGLARCAAFMGHRILSATLGDDPYSGLLARVPVEEYRAELRGRLPEAMAGAEFLARWGETADEATTVNPAVTYRVRAATDHHVFDNERSIDFLLALEAYRYTTDTAHLAQAGELMRASNDSYRDNAGLGAAEVDVLVGLAGELGPARGVYGAKITGGGCGGSVALLTDEAGLTEIGGLVKRYQAATGAAARVFRGSTDGLAATGCVAVEF